MSPLSRGSQQQPIDHDPALLVLWGDVNSSDINEPALNDWWTNEHLPERLTIPGFTRARRYFSRNDSVNKTNYLTLYEVKNLAVLTSPEYMEKLNNPTAGTKEHIPTLATMHRCACKFIHYQARMDLVSCPAVVGGSLVMISRYLPDEEAVQKQLDITLDMFRRMQSTDKTLMAFSLLQEDRAATEPGSSSQSYLNVKLKPSAGPGGIRAILLLEFSSPARLPFPDTSARLEPILHELRLQENSDVMAYDLMCVVDELVEDSERL